MDDTILIYSIILVIIFYLIMHFLSKSKNDTINAIGSIIATLINIGFIIITSIWGLILMVFCGIVKNIELDGIIIILFLGLNIYLIIKRFFFKPEENKIIINPEKTDYDNMYKEIKEFIYITFNFNNSQKSLVNYFCNKFFQTNYEVFDDIDDFKLDYIYFYSLGLLKNDLSSIENIDKNLLNNDLTPICNLIQNKEILSKYSLMFQELIYRYIAKKFNIELEIIKNEPDLEKYLKQ